MEVYIIVICCIVASGFIAEYRNNMLKRRKEKFYKEYKNSRHE